MRARQNVPLVDLRAAHAEIAEEVRRGFDRVLAATAFVNGPDVSAFEEEFAEFSGVAHCIGAANGTDALELALRALELPAGAGVVLPANTFVATAEAVVRAGLRPVLADADPEYLLLDPVRAEAACADARARVLLPVHLNGQLAPMADLAELAAAGGGLHLVEDAAQAQGATHRQRPAGSWGIAAGTSFYPGKNLGAYGDAGAVLTPSAELAAAVRAMTDHGSTRKYHHERFGFNSRLDTLQAVVLRAKLVRLPGWNAARRAAAGRYRELLAGLAARELLRLPAVLPGNEHVWHLYAVRVAADVRDAVLSDLNEAGIGVGVHYPVPVHLQPAFAELGYKQGDFPVTEAAAAELLTLPMYPQLTAGQQEYVAEHLGKALAGHGS